MKRSYDLKLVYDYIWGNDIEGYRVKPLIFANQKENCQMYKIKTAEKV